MSVVDGSNDAMRSLLIALDILSNNNQRNPTQQFIVYCDEQGQRFFEGRVRVEERRRGRLRSVMALIISPHRTTNNSFAFVLSEWLSLLLSSYPGGPYKQ